MANTAKRILSSLISPQVGLRYLNAPPAHIILGSCRFKPCLGTWFISKKSYLFQSKKYVGVWPDVREGKGPWACVIAIKATFMAGVETNFNAFWFSQLEAVQRQQWQCRRWLAKLKKTVFRSKNKSFFGRLKSVFAATYIFGGKSKCLLYVADDLSVVKNWNGQHDILLSFKKYLPHEDDNDGGST